MKSTKLFLFLVVISFSLVLLGCEQPTKTPDTSSLIEGVSTNGFDQFGYNYKARLFNGWYGQWYWKRIHPAPYPGSWDAMLVMKWSVDWIPQADEPIGAWTTNHWTWYSNDYDAGTFYGWDTRVAWDDNIAPAANYKVVELLKIMKVDDNAEAWAVYEAGGAYSAGWGTYGSGVPQYVVFQDVITVSNTSGDVIATINMATAGPKGLGKPIF